MLQIFELLERLDAGHSAQARLMVWDGENYVPSRKTVTLYDFVGAHGQAGDRGYCFHSGVSQRWEVVAGLLTQEYRQVL